ncbi:MAG: hypothetical protein FWC41_13550 [Firmicutes bacterium]|nr:hypothetical protein [Bacillota bacterium]
MENQTEKYTPESVWQMFAETDRKIRELSVERKETEKIIRELSAEGKDTDRRIKELTKNVYGISMSNGMMAEEIIFSSLEKDMTFAGVKFDEITPRVPIVDGFKTLTDLDAVMLNGDSIAIIEAKHKVEKKDVRELASKKVNYFKQYFPEFSKYKILLGVGGMSFDDDAIEEAKYKGVGIIKVVGDKVEYHTEGIKEY